MAFPTSTESSTTLAQLIPLKWGERINDFFKLKLMMADFFVNRSDELADGGSALYTPNLSEMSANSKTNATAVTLNNPTETKITLTIDQWYEVSFAIEDKEAAQVKRSYYVQEKYAMNAGYTIAKKLEVAIASLFNGFNTAIGTSLLTLSDSIIRQAIAQLEATGIDTQSGDVAFFVNPVVFWKHIQNLDKFSLAINSPVNDPTSKAPKATLYGIPVYVTNNIQYVSGTTGLWNTLAHRDAIHWAASPLGEGGSLDDNTGTSMTGKYGVRIQSHYIPEYLSTLTTADLLYGVIENRDNAAVSILTKEL